MGRCAEADRWVGGCAGRRAGGQEDRRQTGGHAGMQVVRHAGRQAGRQEGRKPAGGQAGRQVVR